MKKRHIYEKNVFKRISKHQKIYKSSKIWTQTVWVEGKKIIHCPAMVAVVGQWVWNSWRFISDSRVFQLKSSDNLAKNDLVP